MYYYVFIFGNKNNYYKEMSNLLQEELAPAHQKLDHSESGQDK